MEITLCHPSFEVSCAVHCSKLCDSIQTLALLIMTYMNSILTLALHCDFLPLEPISIRGAVNWMGKYHLYVRYWMGKYHLYVLWFELVCGLVCIKLQIKHSNHKN